MRLEKYLTAHYNRINKTKMVFIMNEEFLAH